MMGLNWKGHEGCVSVLFETKPPRFQEKLPPTPVDLSGFRDGSGGKF